MVYILLRRISSYTGADLLLGAFFTLEEAEAAKSTYLWRYEAAPETDPWREQAYKKTRLDGDLMTQAVDFTGSQDGDLFVVSTYAEGLGQILRRVVSVHSSADEARIRIAEIDEAIESGENTSVDYALYQQVQPGVLLSDRPEHQPSLRVS